MVQRAGMMYGLEMVVLTKLQVVELKMLLWRKVQRGKAEMVCAEGGYTSSGYTGQVVEGELLRVTRQEGKRKTTQEIHGFSEGEGQCGRIGNQGQGEMVADVIMWQPIKGGARRTTTVWMKNPPLCFIFF